MRDWCACAKRVLGRRTEGIRKFAASKGAARLVKTRRFCDGDGGDQAARLAQASISTLSAGVASDEMNSSVMHGR